MCFLRGRWICLEIDKFFLEEGLTEAIITAEIVENGGLQGLPTQSVPYMQNIISGNSLLDI